MTTISYFVLGLLLLTVMVTPAGAAANEGVTRTAGGQLIKAPAAPEDQPGWLAKLKEWRESVKFDRAQYDDPRQAWTQRSFVQALVIAQERTLFDSVTGKYTVDRYLKDVTERYGGVDSVIIWHTYPNIGIDDRNQHDHLRDMPGGLSGLKKMVGDFHKRGVRVLFPIMPWDSGTRLEDLSLPEATARDMAEIGADGVFGDTLNGIAQRFNDDAAKAGIPLVLEPELNLGADGMLAWNSASWGQFWDEPVAPGISAYKWVEARHMVHVTSRWSKDRSGDLQRAFLNGTGYESWENIWGLWNGMTDRDAANLRRISAIQREFAPLLSSPDWEPYASTQQDNVFASRFPSGGRTLWTLVNRTAKTVTGVVLRVPRLSGVRYYDLWHGVELAPKQAGEWDVLALEMDPNGFAAVLSEGGNPSAALKRLLARIAAMPKPLVVSSWTMLPQRMSPIGATAKARSAPAGMVRIPGGPYEFRVSGVEIEGGDDFGIDVQYPWEDSPRREHTHRLEVATFYIDRTPVTNAQFKRFVDGSHYRPRDTHNYLRDWASGAYPDGWANKPVTWVSMEDARAYAKWAGKRLPHEWEWQYAAQGADGRAYPWGMEPNAAAMPATDTGRTMRPPADVDAHPSGGSPFGVLDLVGNVWQWTDEYTDDHTRAAILRGGSHYKPQGSDWYFPQALRLDQHGKYLLVSPGKDRSAAIGFRCVVDAEG